jgi:hypothetical protein
MTTIPAIAALLFVADERRTKRREKTERGLGKILNMLKDGDGGFQASIRLLPPSRLCEEAFCGLSGLN